MEEADAARLEAGFALMGWSKPASLFERYLAARASGEREVWVAQLDETPVGYVTVVWRSDDPMFGDRQIPEIVDLNVLRAHRRRGLGSALLEAAEGAVAGRADIVGLRVGLHAGYGSAQRLYVRRGYIPDGEGAIAGGRVIAEGAEIVLDDEVTLRMTKVLSQGTRVPE